IGRAEASLPPRQSSVPPVEPLGLPTRQISIREIDFPAIQAMHRASALGSGAEAAAWREPPLRRELPPPSGPLVDLRQRPESELPSTTVDAVIRRRRSVRHYDVEANLPFAAFSTLLDRSSRGFAADCLDPHAGPLYDAYLIVNGVEGLEPGSYVFHPRRRAVERLSAGNQRSDAAHLACDQS